MGFLVAAEEECEPGVEEEEAVREERIEAADCFRMVCLGAVTAPGTLGGDLTA